MKVASSQGSVEFAGRYFDGIATLLLPRTDRGRLIGFALRPTITTPIASFFASAGYAGRGDRGPGTTLMGQS